MPDIAKIGLAVELIRKAQRMIVLTGAGISTPSGIPDFRSEDTGLWRDARAMEAATYQTFRHDPEKFYAWFRPLAAKMWGAEPNAAHYALAELEKQVNIRAILTQNVDMLHARAGSQNVLPLHGSLQTLSCTRCFQQYQSQDFLEAFITAGALPYCPRCGAILKPDVILFGEQLPQKNWLQARNLVRRCDLMLVAGSSLEVLPVAKLPVMALDAGAHVIIVNHSATYLDVRADLVFHDDVIEILPAISRGVLSYV